MILREIYNILSESFSGRNYVHIRSNPCLINEDDFKNEFNLYIIIEYCCKPFIINCISINTCDLIRNFIFTVLKNVT